MLLRSHLTTTSVSNEVGVNKSTTRKAAFHPDQVNGGCLGKQIFQVALRSRHSHWNTLYRKHTHNQQEKHWLCFVASP